MIDDRLRKVESKLERQAHTFKIQSKVPKKYPTRSRKPREKFDKSRQGAEESRKDLEKCTRELERSIEKFGKSRQYVDIPG